LPDGVRPAALAFACLLAFATPASPATVESRIEEWVQHVAQMELVCEGVIEATTPVTVQGNSTPSPVCGGFIPENGGKNFRVAVGSVAVGSIPSSSYDVRVIAPAGSAPGTHVVFWGARMCSDGWHPWGYSIYVHEDSTLELFTESLNGERTQGRIPLAQFLDRVRRAADGRRKAWSGFRELVSARVVESSWNKARRELSYRCEDLNDSRREWRAIFQPSRSAIWSEMSAGDTLLLPVTDPASRTVTYATAPTSFEVRCGYVPGLGLSFSDRMAAFELLTGRYRLRSIGNQSGTL
jgi:hypothetical protein